MFYSLTDPINTAKVEFFVAHIGLCLTFNRTNGTSSQHS
jgi:hypothetical protein